MKILTRDQMDVIDVLYPSPKVQAEEVNAILQRAATELKMDHSLMSITCFSIQWLAMLALGQFSGDEDFVRIAKLANIWLHRIHYNHAEDLYTPREEEPSDGIQSPETQSPSP